MSQCEKDRRIVPFYAQNGNAVEANSVLHDKLSRVDQAPVLTSHCLNVQLKPLVEKCVNDSIKNWEEKSIVWKETSLPQVLPASKSHLISDSISKAQKVEVVNKDLYITQKAKFNTQSLKNRYIKKSLSIIIKRKGRSFIVKRKGGSFIHHWNKKKKKLLNTKGSNYHAHMLKLNNSSMPDISPTVDDNESPVYSARSWMLSRNAIPDTSTKIYKAHFAWFSAIHQPTLNSEASLHLKYHEYVHLVRVESTVAVIFNKLADDAKAGLSSSVIYKNWPNDAPEVNETELPFLLTSSPMYDYQKEDMVWKKCCLNNGTEEDNHWQGILYMRKIWAGLCSLKEGHKCLTMFFSSNSLKSVLELTRAISRTLVVPCCLHISRKVCSMLEEMSILGSTINVEDVADVQQSANGKCLYSRACSQSTTQENVSESTNSDLPTGQEIVERSLTPCPSKISIDSQKETSSHKDTSVLINNSEKSSTQGSLIFQESVMSPPKESPQLSKKNLSNPSLLPSWSAASVLSGTGASVPPGSAASVPSWGGTSVPTWGGASIPSGDGASVPSGSDESVPSGNGASVPSGDDASVPSGSSVSVPSGSSVSIPSGSSVSVPSGSGVCLPSVSSESNTSEMVQTVISNIVTKHFQESPSENILPSIAGGGSTTETSTPIIETCSPGTSTSSVSGILTQADISHIANLPQDKVPKKSKKNESSPRKIKRARKSTFCPSNADYFKPLSMGWVREVVNRVVTENCRQDIYYHPPVGRKLRSSVEVEKYLSANNVDGLLMENFTFFHEKLGFGPPYELERTAYMRKYFKRKSENSDQIESTPKKKLKSPKTEPADKKPSKPKKKKTESVDQNPSKPKKKSELPEKEAASGLLNDSWSDEVAITNEVGETTGYEDWISQGSTNLDHEVEKIGEGSSRQNNGDKTIKFVNDNTMDIINESLMTVKYKPMETENSNSLKVVKNKLFRILSGEPTQLINNKPALVKNENKVVNKPIGVRDEPDGLCVRLEECLKPKNVSKIYKGPCYREASVLDKGQLNASTNASGDTMELENRSFEKRKQTLSTPKTNILPVSKNSWLSIIDQYVRRKGLWNVKRAKPDSHPVIQDQVQDNIHPVISLVESEKVVDTDSSVPKDYPLRVWHMPLTSNSMTPVTENAANKSLTPVSENSACKSLTPASENSACKSLTPASENSACKSLTPTSENAGFKPVTPVSKSDVSRIRVRRFSELLQNPETSTLVPNDKSNEQSCPESSVDHSGNYSLRKITVRVRRGGKTQGQSNSFVVNKGECSSGPSHSKGMIGSNDNSLSTYSLSEQASQTSNVQPHPTNSPEYHYHLPAKIMPDGSLSQVVLVQKSVNNNVAMAMAVPHGTPSQQQITPVPQNAIISSQQIPTSSIVTSAGWQPPVRGVQPNIPQLQTGTYNSLNSQCEQQTAAFLPIAANESVVSNMQLETSNSQSYQAGQQVLPLICSDSFRQSNNNATNSSACYVQSGTQQPTNLPFAVPTDVGNVAAPSQLPQGFPQPVYRILSNLYPNNDVNMGAPCLLPQSSLQNNLG